MHVNTMTSMAAMRSFRRDPSVAGRKLPPGTVRRILGIARPYRRDLGVLPGRWWSARR